MGGHDPYSASKGCAELVFNAYLKSFFSQSAQANRTIGAALWQDPKKYSGAWNCGPDDSSYLTVAEMSDRLIKYWGYGSWEDFYDPKAPHEAKLLKLCCDKAHTGLHWHSVLSMDECLQMTADWYKEFYSGPQTKDMHQFCVEQIRKYEGSAATKNIMYAQSG